MGFIQIVLIGIAAYLGFMLCGFHQVTQGYVGIYKRFGVLQKKLAEPGYHFSLPLAEQFIEIKVSIQTDEVKNVPCGTSNGTLVYFDKIEVVNKLRKDMVYKTVLNYTQAYDKYWITDKIQHEINQFCSKHSLQEIYIDIFDKLDEQLMKALNRDLEIWAPGIQILSVRVTKPNVPERIRKNFEKMEKLKIDYFIATEKEKVLIEQQVTKQKKQLIKMESNLDVKAIDLQKLIDKRKNDLKMAKIEGKMIFAKEKTKIETQFLSAFQEAQLYPKLYTQKYLSFLAFDALTSNTTLNLGNKIPNIIIDKGLKLKTSKKSKKTKLKSKKAKDNSNESVSPQSSNLQKPKQDQKPKSKSQEPNNN